MSLSTLPNNLVMPLVSNGVSLQAPESISIQDLESGKLNLDALIIEVQQLKTKISDLRYEMTQYLRILSSVDENTVPLTVYQEAVNQVATLKASGDAYFNSYKRLLPIIRYSKLKNRINPDDTIRITKHDVPIERLQDSSPGKIKGSGSTPNPTTGRKSGARGARRRNSRKQ
ncbi:hypothetical protein FOA43_003527 [Brettanomyces nanus]|uniref:Uncharacterized protein n=1 Tax=Eeniella nana TaxID=13502 RepID=A0A875S364_EENNA|nr:uncharacterized protein FOA43_003527 [Brettanomyces nanus]QPG76141.1 hypothetical protein FOA43_003527 [Brettanomyces nanus]